MNDTQGGGGCIVRVRICKLVRRFCREITSTILELKHRYMYDFGSKALLSIAFQNRRYAMFKYKSEVNFRTKVPPS